MTNASMQFSPTHQEINTFKRCFKRLQRLYDFRPSAAFAPEVKQLANFMENRRNQQVCIDPPNHHLAFVFTRGMVRKQTIRLPWDCCFHMSALTDPGLSGACLENLKGFQHTLVDKVTNIPPCGVLTLKKCTLVYLSIVYYVISSIIMHKDIDNR